MKVLVLGASGGCGKEVVKQAVDRGFDVTAITREQTVYVPPNGVRHLRGEVLDPAFIKEIVKGHTKIISCLGIKRSNPLNPWSKLVSPEGFTTKVMANIIEATGNSEEISIAVISAGGVGDSIQNTTPIMKFMIANSNLKPAYQDLEEMEHLLSESALNWIAVRPVTLTNGRSQKAIKVTESYPITAMISRVNVASWLVDQIESNKVFSVRKVMIRE